MSKHTPAPWYDGAIQTARLDNRFNGCDIEAGNGACVGIAYYTAGDIDAAECRANARLIAAAPELLEALQDLVANLQRTRDGNYLLINDGTGINRYAAAIEKAIGGAA